jgi:hypothetical protein
MVFHKVSVRVADLEANGIARAQLSSRDSMAQWRVLPTALHARHSQVKNYAVFRVTVGAVSWLLKCLEKVMRRE